MHYAPHALLHCVAWLSLLSCGNAARGASPASEVLTHFAHTVGTVLAPSLASEAHAARQNRSSHGLKDQPIRRQTDESEAPSAGEPSEAGVAPGPAAGAPGGAGALAVGGVSPFPAQGIPFQYERTYRYRYPPFNEQLTQNFYPGNAAATGFGNQLLSSGVPLDPRFIQAQLGGSQQLQLAPAEAVKSGVNANANGAKESGSGVNTIQGLEAGVGGGDSKSSAQSRPFEGSEFAALQQAGVGGGGAGAGAGAGGGGGGRFGNVRVDNRFSTLGYERVRQDYYRDPPLDQQNYFSQSFNEIPFAGGAGYRSPIGDRYSSLEYTGRPGIGPSSDLRSSNGLGGLGEPYFGNFFQGPYQSLNYNSLPGGGGGGGGGGVGAAEGAGPGFDNFRFGPGGGNFQYPAAGGGGAGGSPYFQGGDGTGFGEGDSSLRASSAKATVSETGTRRQGEERPEENAEGKVTYVATADKTEKPTESGQA